MQTALPPNDVVGLVLAGGLSRRMGGGDKALHLLGGKPMLGHVIARLRPQVGLLVLSANGDPARFAQFGLPVVADTIPGFAGPLAGVLAGMHWARRQVPGARWIVSAAADTPFFPTDLVSKFVTAAAAKFNRVVLASSEDGTHPVFGLWPVALADDLERALTAGTRKILAWTDSHDTVLVTFAHFQAGDRAVDPFFNANRPQDLAEAEAILKQMRS